MKSLMMLVAYSLVLAVAAGVKDPQTTTLYAVSTRDGNGVYVTGAPSPNAVAQVNYKYSLSTIGWDIMNLTTSPAFPDKLQAYAAGFLEGYVTYEGTWYSWLNIYAQHPNGSNIDPPLDPRMVDWFNENDAWVQSQIDANSGNDTYWYQVMLQMEQFHGLLDGLNTVAPTGQQFTRVMLIAMVSQGDVYDLLNVLNITQVDWTKLTPQQYRIWLAKHSRCSALFKIAADYSDVFMGHTTWGMFNSMVRAYKHLTLSFSSGGTKSKQISFSSYPGCLSSVDDFYVTDAGLVVIETTLNCLNATLYQKVTPKSVMYWVRVMVASRMASSPTEWTDIFSRYNSGTYNNQWMVFDMKKFTPGKPMPPETMVIAEQIPGQVLVQDATQTLQYGYWPSYNVPSIPAAFDAMGYPWAVAVQGPEMNDYQTNVRGKMFRQQQGDIRDISGFQFLLQYNDYERDPLSEGDPIFAISSRGDLLSKEKHGPECFGGVDTKVTSWSLFNRSRQVMIYGGPTPQQKTLDFVKLNVTKFGCSPRYGVPDVWNFDWQTVAP